jgi:hypothetical protein
MPGGLAPEKITDLARVADLSIVEQLHNQGLQVGKSGQVLGAYWRRDLPSFGL